MLAFASDRIGHIVVQRVFEQCELPIKEEIVQQLHQSKQRLAGNKFGVSSLRAAHVDLYARDVNEWRRRMKRTDEGHALLQELQAQEELHGQRAAKSHSKNKRNNGRKHAEESKPKRGKRDRDTKEVGGADMEAVKRLKNTRVLSKKDIQHELDRIHADSK